MTLFGKILTGGFLFVVAVGGVLYMTKPSAVVEEGVPEVVVMESTSTAPTNGKKMAFSQFVASDKGSYKCEVNQSVSNIETKGQVYVKNGMIKGEFTTNVGGQSFTTHTIARDGYSYSWSSMAPTTGYKVKIATDVNTATGSTTTTSTSGTYAWNAEQIGDYNCVPEEVDDASFTIPLTINFTAMN